MIFDNLSNPFIPSVSQRFQELFGLAETSDFFLELLKKQPRDSEFLNNFFTDLEQIDQSHFKPDMDENVNESIKDHFFMSERVVSVYIRLLRKTTLSVREEKRIQILLGFVDQEQSISSVAEQLATTRKTVRKWLTRFVNYSIYLQLPCVQELKGGPYTELIRFILRDAPRSGREPLFSADVILNILFLACEAPEFSDRSISQWSARELADEAVKRGFVESIAPRTIKRFLQQVDLKPHLSRYWLNSPEKDKPGFDRQVKQVCELYLNVSDYSEKNIRIISTDEKTGIQAVERASPSASVKPGRVEQQEHNYDRHGTLSLIAGLEVATGKIVEPLIRPTRKEQDFLDAIKGIIATDPTAKYIFIADQLNTHKSASLVSYVAEYCSLTQDLGKKGKSGILRSQNTRQDFLKNQEHQISFVYTPKHTSWLNQIEIWFSILSRKLLKRGNFPSIEELKKKLFMFINYYNFTMAKPFKWVYKGKPLQI